MPLHSPKNQHIDIAIEKFEPSTALVYFNKTALNDTKPETNYAEFKCSIFSFEFHIYGSR